MHYRPGQSMTFDSDGLQADVMRFMAIIAFCLIAILALVQNMGPPGPESVVELAPLPVSEVLVDELVQVTVRPVEQHSERPGAKVKTVSKRVEALPVEELTLPSEIVPISLQEPPPFLQEPPPFLQEPPQRLQEQPPSLQEPPRRLEEQPPSLQEQPRRLEEPQLALRFVSDDAFVALISTGKIQLYAQAASDYYLMAANFDITQSPPAGALYALLPTSIPGKISRLFQRTVLAESYLVALPGDMQSELNGFLHDISGRDAPGGTLVIHRNGHLSYEN